MTEAMDAGPLYTADDFATEFNVSRETMAALEDYEKALRRWQRTLNLVGPGTLEDFWHRHILDSAQIVRFLPAGALRVLDMGSGAGFPGLVLALLLKETRPGLQVTLVESHQRKAAFLGHVIGLTGAPARVLTGRLESLECEAQDVITARALAPLPELLAYAERYSTGHTLYMFLKGQDVEVELTQAAKYWSMTVDRHKSLSDPTGTLLAIKDSHRVSSET